MEQLIQTNIANHVSFIDDCYIDSRISCIERTTDWTAEHYIAWRTNLLEKKAIDHKLVVRDLGDRRDEYLQRRYQLLEQKYKLPEIPTSKHTSNEINTNTTSPTSSTTTNINAKIRPESTSTSSSSSSTPTTSSPSMSVHHINKIVRLDDFSFSGMHHIYDSHRKPITRIRYANNSRDLLAFSSDDGTLSLCNTHATPPCVMATFKGHNGPIIDFVWTNDNDRIVTIGVDSTMRIWSTRTGKEESVVRDAGVCMTICTHPIRSPLIIVSENKSFVKVYDISQSKWLSKVKSLSLVLSMEFESKGEYLFLGDDKGFIFVFKFENKSSSFSLVSKTQVSSKPTVSVSVHYWQLAQKPGLSLLVNSKDSMMRVFSIKSLHTGSFMLSKEYPIHAKKHQSVRSCFCPISNKRDGVFSVCGGDDGIVYIYDQLKKENQPINQLMGHASPVIDCAWNGDESNLASADLSGTVIIWNRAILSK